MTDSIVLKDGQVQFMDSKFNSVVTYQYFTDKVFLEITGFSVSCGKIHLTWYLLSAMSPCSSNSPFSGSLTGTSRYQTVYGLKMKDNRNYKFAVRASDIRRKVNKVVCTGVIVVDTSKPQGGWIRDGPARDRSYQSSKFLQVNWGGVQTRNGVARYDWKVRSIPFKSNQFTEVMPFKNANRNTNAGMSTSSISDGSKVFFIVRAYTKAGLFSDLKSDGVVIDTSAPVAG